MKKLEDMKNFNDYSDDDLLDELDYLSLELNRQFVYCSIIKKR